MATSFVVVLAHIALIMLFDGLMSGVLETPIPHHSGRWSTGTSRLRHDRMHLLSAAGSTRFIVCCSFSAQTIFSSHLSAWCHCRHICSSDGVLFEEARIVIVYRRSSSFSEFGSGLETDPLRATENDQATKVRGIDGVVGCFLVHILDDLFAGRSKKVFEAGGLLVDRTGLRYLQGGELQT